VNPRSFFLLIAPLGLASLYVEALAEIAKLTCSLSFCRVIVNAVDAQEVVEIMEDG